MFRAACAGLSRSEGTNTDAPAFRHSRERGNPVTLKLPLSVDLPSLDRVGTKVAGFPRSRE
ncbi:hypothetical protein AZ78_1406 [Lysobacter capsici AZ78]|uniref:Uncharacterized protein n=1 Tax=Lysobacter capsici AZ78 TaxID=1444315 RepID=A0A108U7A3_9GAMM|nr:hypothetical protein AZ78_1406 [Lysobacter capsici AZ78]